MYKVNLSLIQFSLHQNSISTVVEVMERLSSLRAVRESYGLKETGLLTYTYPR